MSKDDRKAALRIAFALLLGLASTLEGKGESNSVSHNSTEVRSISLPTDRDIPAEVEQFQDDAAGDPSRSFRPRFRFAFEWEPKTDGVAIENYDLRVTMPTYPAFGPPPPTLSRAPFS